VLRVSEDIVPVAEFKAHLSEVVRGLPARGRPIVVTVNGKPAAVVMAPADFDRLSQRAAFHEAVSQGLDDSAKRRVLSDDAVGRIADARFGALPKPKRKRR
jgi:prevent-host-death family protein